MSGHSKWSTIKHKKGAADARRGKLFTKLIKEMTVAARAGGGDPDGNPRLRAAIVAARGANMPADNIKRAIQRGTGELPGMAYEEVAYEGYAAGGVAVFLQTLTDNRMRTTPEIRHLFAKHGGSLAEPNAVAWMFERRGQLRVPSSAAAEETLMECALEAGADDLRQEDDAFLITTSPDAVHAVASALEREGIKGAEITVVMEPKNVVELDGKKADQCLRLLEALEDHEDVQQVFANAAIADPAGSD